MTSLDALAALVPFLHAHRDPQPGDLIAAESSPSPPAWPPQWPLQRKDKAAARSWATSIALIDIADTVTTMGETKHAYQQGIRAKKGIATEGPGPSGPGSGAQSAGRSV